MLRRLVPIRRDVGGYRKRLVIKVAQKKGLLDICRPQWGCLWAYSPHRTILDVFSVLFWKYRCLESQVANWRCRVADIGKIIETMGALFQISVMKIKPKKTRLTLNEIAWCSSYPRSTTGKMEARHAEASVSSNTMTILTPEEQNKTAGKRGPLELLGLY